MLGHFVLARGEVDGMKTQSKVATSTSTPYETTSLKTQRCNHEAYTGLVKASVAHPYHVGCSLLLACFCETRGLYREAIDSYRHVRSVLASQESIRTDLADQALVQISIRNLARCLCRVGEFQEAVNLFMELDCADALSDDSLALQSYAAALQKLGKKEEAVQISQRATSAAVSYLQMQTESTNTEIVNSIPGKEAQNILSSSLSSNAAILHESQDEEQLQQLLSRVLSEIPVKEIRAITLVVSLASFIQRSSHTAVQQLIEYIKQEPGQGTNRTVEVSLLCGCYCAVVGSNDHALRYLMKVCHKALSTYAG